MQYFLATASLIFASASFSTAHAADVVVPVAPVVSVAPVVQVVPVVPVIAGAQVEAVPEVQATANHAASLPVTAQSATAAAGKSRGDVVAELIRAKQDGTFTEVSEAYPAAFYYQPKE